MQMNQSSSNNVVFSNTGEVPMFSGNFATHNQLQGQVPYVPAQMVPDINYQAPLMPITAPFVPIGVGQENYTSLMPTMQVLYPMQGNFDMNQQFYPMMVPDPNLMIQQPQMVFVSMPNQIAVPAAQPQFQTFNGPYPVQKDEQESVSSEQPVSTTSSGSKSPPPGFHISKEKVVEPLPKVVNYASIARSKPKREQKKVAPKPVQRKAPTPRAAPKKKFGFRSKQNKIDVVYNALQEKYTNLGILADKDEVLRGDDTIRLHVKKFKALCRIEDAMRAVEQTPGIVIKKVSAPLSMKNQFQKKGFLIYCQVAEVSMVPIAQAVFRQFEEFKKCEVARQTIPAIPVQEEVAFPAPSREVVTVREPQGSPAAAPMMKVDVFDDFDLGLCPVPLGPKLSYGEAGF